MKALLKFFRFGMRVEGVVRGGVCVRGWGMGAERAATERLVAVVEILSARERKGCLVVGPAFACVQEGPSGERRSFDRRARVFLGSENGKHL